LGHMVDMSRRLATVAYSQFQEVEADAQGMRLSIDSRYDPEAAARVFARMSMTLEGGAKPREKTPVGEVARSTASVLSDYFRSHPPSADRTRRLEEQLRKERPTFGATDFYVGKRNIVEHIPFIVQAFKDEWRRMQ
jgi:Zn-dependent protease with chaperone function